MDKENGDIATPLQRNQALQTESDQQEPVIKKTKKCHGNKKLHHFKRKCRSRGMTEEEITETVKGIHRSERIMTVLIAHRLSTVMHADRIYVLEKGHIIEQGKHEDLIKQGGLYYAMWRQQIGERKNSDDKSPTLKPMHA